MHEEHTQATRLTSRSATAKPHAGLHRWVLVVLVVSALTLIFAPPAAAADGAFVVIVHPDVPLDSADRAQISEAFMRKLGRWQDGTPVRPVTLRDEAVREDFARTIHGRSDTDIRKHWQYLVFTGRGTPPLERDSNLDVIEYVRTTPGAIGYVARGAKVSGVKTVSLQ